MTTNRPHATTEEQRSDLGKVKRKPRFVDMFTGDVSAAPPKRGNGAHVRLRPVGIERPAIPGMASWADGPDGKRCQSCDGLSAVAIQRPNGDVERASAACLRYCQRVGRLPAIRRDLTLERACDQFSERGPESPRAWLIDRAGTVHAPDWTDRNGVGRFHLLNEYEDKLRPGHMSVSR